MKDATQNKNNDTIYLYIWLLDFHLTALKFLFVDGWSDNRFFLLKVKSSIQKQVSEIWHSQNESERKHASKRFSSYHMLTFLNLFKVRGLQEVKVLLHLDNK